MALDPVTAIATAVDRVLGAVLPDKAQQESAKAQLAQLVINGELQQAAAQLSADVASIQAVNATMQDESKSGHFLQWAWRPICGVTLALVVFNNYVLLTYLSAFGAKQIDVPDKVWNTLLAVVGVSALTRGMEKVVAALPDLSAVLGKGDKK